MFSMWFYHKFFFWTNAKRDWSGTRDEHFEVMFSLRFWAPRAQSSEDKTAPLQGGNAALCHVLTASAAVGDTLSLLAYVTYIPRSSKPSQKTKLRNTFNSSYW